MVSLDWTVERVDGVTLVSLFVSSERECRVRIANRLDGPVWPPRRRGRPAAGWDDGEFTGTVPADGRLTVGYATSASPAEPPAEIRSTGPPSGTDDGSRPGGGDGRRTTGVRGQGATDGQRVTDGGDPGGTTAAPDVDATPAGVVRSLGDPVVPRDCVPVPDDTGDAARSDEGVGGAGPDRGETPGGPDRRGGVEDADGGDPPEFRRTDRPDSARRGDALLVPGAVRAWLRDVERRLDAAGAVRDADRSAAGRAPRPAGLSDAAAADRRALSWLAGRIDGLRAGAKSEANGATGDHVGEPSDGVR